MHIYLLQRGKFTENPININSNRILLDVIDLDYMGAAEFEWGALPGSFKRMMAAYITNNAFKFKVVNTDLKNMNNVPLYMIYANNDIESEEDAKKYYNSYINEIKKYIDGNNPHKISTYRLKEHTSLHERFYDFYIDVNRRDYERKLEYYKNIHIKYSGSDNRDTFWWDIGNDVMLMFGEDKARLVKNIFYLYATNDSLKELFKEE